MPAGAGGRGRTWSGTPIAPAFDRRMPLLLATKPGIKILRVSTSLRLPSSNPVRGPNRRADIGAVSIRLAHGVRRAFIKVAHPNRWKLRAVMVWEEANGPIPKGHVIHHDDRNALNDDLANLICLTRAQHLDEHRAEHVRA